MGYESVQNKPNKPSLLSSRLSRDAVAAKTRSVSGEWVAISLSNSRPV